jgi:hypothetical protein
MIMPLEPRKSGSNRVQGWSLALRVPRRDTVRLVGGPTHSVLRVSVRVDGIPWDQVETLESARPNDQVYVVSTAEDGTTTIRFGDGKCGFRLPKSVERISAYYRTGGGAAGNVPEKKDQGGADSIAYLDVWTGEVTAIEDVQLREPALDGVDSSVGDSVPRKANRTD